MSAAPAAEAPCLLAGAVAVVVGGATGIGRAVVERFAAEGARGVVVDVAAGPLQELRAHLPAGSFETVSGDASRPGSAAEAVSAATARFGGVDVLVCCAGRFDFQTRICSLGVEELDRAFDDIFAVNVKSSLLAVHAAAEQLRRRRGSVILTLSSSAFYPEGAGALYGASKWAGRGLVSHLARELAPEVRVNAVAPGGTSGTRLAAVDALGITGSVEDVAGRDERLRAGNLLGAVPVPGDHTGSYVFLASPLMSGHVTGAVINSDGGRGDPLPPAATDQRREGDSCAGGS